MVSATGTALGIATAVTAILLAASSADACGCMVVEETCVKHLPVESPCQHQQPVAPQIAVPAVYAVPYPVHVAGYNNNNNNHNNNHGGNGGGCTCGCKTEGTCTCGGNKHDGTCTCGGKKKESTCPCGGNKHDGTCTCGKKREDVSVKQFAEEGLTTLFKVVRGGMKMVENLADHMSKVKKPCGCGPKPCGCGLGGPGPLGPRPCGCLGPCTCGGGCGGGCSGSCGGGCSCGCGGGCGCGCK